MRLHFPYMNLIHGTRTVPILGAMRKTIILLVLLALALPVVAVSATSAGEGTLSVDDGRGKVTVRARGGIIGRLDRGSITIFDLTPGDANQPVVTGDDQPIRLVGENGILYRGLGLRFRVIGGSFRVLVQGRGIDLSVVGRGDGFIEADDSLDPGVYSLDGADCRKDRASCEVLPQPGIRFKLAAPERPAERNAIRPGSE
jgi:hypothetical protein